MRKYVFSCCLLLMVVQLQAQQKPHYTQYVLNQYIINPALTGIENYTDVKISHRHQWLGIEGAPVTSYFTIHAPLGKKDYKTTATSFPVPGENPRGNQYWENYTVSPPHHGIGLQVIDDRTGPLHQFAAYATYAYHKSLSSRTSIAAGLGLGLTRYSLEAGKLNFATTVDPAVYTSGEINKMNPDLNAGIYLYSADYFVGLSAQQLWPAKLEYADNIVRTTKGKMAPHLFATAGYRFLLTEDINLMPSVMLKYLDPVPLQAEVNVKLMYRDFVWAGASYRHKDGFAGMAGINIAGKFNIGYAYDYTTSRLNGYSNGSHEIMLGFLLGNKYGDSCPRNVW